MPPDEFATTVRDVDGVWPEAPQAWSYTSLRDAEECPRRWSLARANYPAVWSHGGYPPRPSLPSLIGDVMHRMLELILRGLYDHSCESLADPCAVAVLRDLGGYTALATRVIHERLAPFEHNPRIGPRLAALRSAMLAHVPDIRQRVQSVVARTHLKAPVRKGLAEDRSRQARGLAEGSHPEVELRVPNLRFVGRADLITIEAGSCSITDYKTGAPDSHHIDQVRTYALLWMSDAAVNPDGIPVKQLVLSYPSSAESVDPPSESDLAALAQQLSSRVSHVENELQVKPPPAHPAPAICRFCAVRHLCDEYWSGPVARTPFVSDIAPDSDFVDCEAVVVGQNGPRSWVVKVPWNETLTLLRTPTESPGFSQGDAIRLLDVARTADDDTGRLILTMTATSEVYRLRSA